MREVWPAQPRLSSTLLPTRICRCLRHQVPRHACAIGILFWKEHSASWLPYLNHDRSPEQDHILERPDAAAEGGADLCCLAITSDLQDKILADEKVPRASDSILLIDFSSLRYSKRDLEHGAIRRCRNYNPLNIDHATAARGRNSIPDP